MFDVGQDPHCVDMKVRRVNLVRVLQLAKLARVFGTHVDDSAAGIQSHNLTSQP